MVRATGLPRQIMRTQLREGFKVARYMEDPRCVASLQRWRLIAKTKNEKVCVCSGDRCQIER